MTQAVAWEREIERLQEQLDAIHRALDERGVPRRDPSTDGLQLSPLGRVRWLLDRAHPAMTFSDGPARCFASQQADNVRSFGGFRGRRKPPNL